MAESKKNLNLRASRILWAVSCDYKYEAIIGQDGGIITVKVDVVNNAFTFSDSKLVYTYRQAHFRIMMLLDEIKDRRSKMMIE